MKTLGRNSFASFLNTMLRIASIILWALLALLFLFGIPCLIIDTYFHDLPFVADAPPAMVIWPSSIMFAILVIAAQIIINRLRRIFRTLIDGDPFVPENARHLRTIWITLVIFEVVRMGYASMVLLLQRVFAQTPELAGLQGKLQVNWPLWLAVAVLVVLAEVFHEGARLRQEQKLTI